MKLTEKLYEAAKPVWDGYLSQPFVKELGEGTLSPERFRFYMIQDYRYLLQYAKVFALGIVKAEEEALQRLFAEMVHETLDGEMQVHKAYMARLGITEAEVAETKTALTNQSYTSYMLDEAHKGGALEILVAVLSCAWSYQMIGESHKKLTGALEHPLYGEWVNGYSCEAYCAGTQRIIDLVDRYGADISAEREAHLKEIFVNCSRYEADFWDMAYEMRG
ncbi:MAG: thiaminase II [Bacillota bacterium]|nr:thiaminase II [Bacillota bacterium]